jgi:hypothetical protein
MPFAIAYRHVSLTRTFVSAFFVSALDPWISSWMIIAPYFLARYIRLHTPDETPGIIAWFAL